MGTFTARLKAQKLIAAESIDALEGEVDAEVREAIAFAESGSWEPVEDLLRNVYTPQITP